MSASREKKNRQELNAGGYVDPKAQRAAEEKAKERKSNALYIIVAVLFVVVAAAVFVWNSGMIQSGSTAMVVDGENYSAAEVSYYYRNAYGQIANSGYASYYGLDTSVSPAQQSLNDTAKMLLGVEEDMTWADYFVQDTQESLARYHSIAKAAEAEGFTFTPEMEAEVKETMDSLTDYAKQSGYSAKDYIKLVYGSVMNMKSFEKMVRQQVLVSGYVTAKQEALDYSLSDLEAYYQSDKECFDVAAYEMLFFASTAQSTTDSEGNTVEPTEEENAAKLAQAEADSQAAFQMLEKAKAPKKVNTPAAAAAEPEETVTLGSIAELYPDASYTNVTTGGNYGGTVDEWVFDSARQDGDIALLTDDTGFFVVAYGHVGRQEYNTVNVRHILIQADTTGLDSTSDTYEADVAKAQAEAKAQADDILAQWKSGDKTEDSFAELAKQYSADGNAADGGIYTQVYQGQMVSSFNDWCFDESRKTGDTAVVETSYGYHVMYFCGEDAPYWQVQVTEELTNSDMNQWMEDVVGDATAELADGMKYVL